MRDQLMTSADTPDITLALKMPLTRTAREASQGIASLFSSEPESADYFRKEDDEANYAEANYALGQR